MSLVKNRVALLIGGASRIGFEYAKTLIKCGIKGIMIADVSKKRGEEVASKLGATNEAEVDFLKTDVSDSVQLRYAFEETIAHFKQLDLTINTACVIEEHHPQKMIQTNFLGTLRGTYMAMMEYLPKYRCAEEGVIVNTVSLSGLLPLASCPVFSTNNHGVVALGRSLGSHYYYKKYRTRILTVCPDVSELSLFRREDMEGIDKILFDLEMRSLPTRTSDQVGLCLMKVMECGVNGSVWMSGCNDIYEIPFPDRGEVRRKMKRDEFMRKHSN